jgi:hypothetical protein
MVAANESAHEIDESIDYERDINKILARVKKIEGET